MALPPLLLMLELEAELQVAQRQVQLLPAALVVAPALFVK
jgi:hypothetical protein